MSESVSFNKSAGRQEIYGELLPQMKVLFAGEKDQIANMANFCAVIKEAFEFLWVGFYLVKGNELVLGPFQGPLACTRIGFGKGVCGTAWKNRAVTIVPDVDQFPGHIACSSKSRSEIVVPLIGSDVIGVLDVDSEKLNDFSEVDSKFLSEMVTLLK